MADLVQEVFLKAYLDIAIANCNPKITEEGIIIAKAVCDPLFSLTADGSRSVTSSASPGLSAPTSQVSNQDVNASLTQSLPIGGSNTLSLTNSRQDTNSRFFQPANGGINPSYRTSLTLSITQNLLKNFGPDVNTAPIEIARNNQAISVTQLRQQANQVITNVHNAYWNLVFAIENLEIQKRSLRLARELEELNKARVRAGVAATVEVTRAEAQAAAQVQYVILAKKAIKDADTFDGLSFQRDLAAAQAHEVQAITTYNQDLANLEFVKGTVLEKNQLEL